VCVCVWVGACACVQVCVSNITACTSATHLECWRYPHAWIPDCHSHCCFDLRGWPLTGTQLLCGFPLPQTVPSVLPQRQHLRIISVGQNHVIYIYIYYAHVYVYRCLYSNFGREITKYTVFAYGSGLPYTYIIKTLAPVTHTGQALLRQWHRGKTTLFRALC
jgi:hypothetical protein